MVRNCPHATFNRIHDLWPQREGRLLAADELRLQRLPPKSAPVEDDADRFFSVFQQVSVYLGSFLRSVA